MKRVLLIISLLTTFVLASTISAYAADKPAKRDATDRVKVELNNGPKDEVRAKVETVKERVQAATKVKTERKLEERIKVKGQNIKFDVPPVIKEGRTLIPLRAITQGLGANVVYDDVNKQITITKDDITVVLTLGSVSLTVNDELRELDVPAQLISNRTFVPLRFLAEIFGEEVEYDEETGDINIGEDDSSSDNNEPDEDIEADNTGDSDTTVEPQPENQDEDVEADTGTTVIITTDDSSAPAN